MDKEKMHKILSSWLDLGKEYNAVWEDLEQYAGVVSDGRLYLAGSNIFEEYTKVIEEFIGDKTGMLTWHWEENNFGARGLEAGFEDDMREMNTVDDLVWFLNALKDKPE